MPRQNKAYLFNEISLLFVMKIKKFPVKLVQYSLTLSVPSISNGDMGSSGTWSKPEYHIPRGAIFCGSQQHRCGGLHVADASISVSRRNILFMKK